MTEEQARQKWCPMFRLAGENDSAAYNVAEGNGKFEFARCIGSDCMMWQEIRQYPSDYKATIRLYPGGQESMTDNSISLGGYCGLAGKP